MSDRRASRGAPLGGLAASPSGATDASRFGAVLRVAAATALSTAFVVTLRVRSICAKIDPGLGDAMLATSVVVLLGTGYMLWRARPRWPIAISLTLTFAAAELVAEQTVRGVAEKYYVRRCLENNRLACRVAFFGGLRPAQGQNGVRALVPACRFGFALPCFDLLERDSALACETSRASCDENPTSSGQACWFAEHYCSPSADLVSACATSRDSCERGDYVPATCDFVATRCDPPGPAP